MSVQNNIKNNCNTLIWIVLVVENLTEGWSLTSPEVNLTIIGTSVKIYGNLALQIPSNAEAKEYWLNLWIKAIRYEEGSHRHVTPVLDKSVFMEPSWRNFYSD